MVEEKFLEKRDTLIYLCVIASDFLPRFFYELQDLTGGRKFIYNQVEIAVK